MQRSYAPSFLAAAALLSAATAFAQQAQRANYRITNYYSVAPDRVNAMLDEARTTGRKLMQARMAAGENITSWTLSRLAFRGDPALDYNFTISIAFDGSPQTVANTAARDQLYRTATGMNVQDYNQKLNSLRTSVGNRMYRVEAAAPGSSVKEGNYVLSSAWKIAQDRGADYGNFVQTMLVPLNTQNVKEGRSNSWLALRVVSPGGASALFDAVINNAVKDLPAALPTTPNSPELAQTRFAQVFPKLNYANFVDMGRALRTQVRTTMSEVIVVVERGSVTSASR